MGAVPKCFAGCSFPAVLSALGLTTNDTLVEKRASERVASTIEAVYQYEDAGGRVVAEKVRVRPKSFKWRRPSGRYGLGGIELPIFNQPSLVDARQVYLVEGEKAVRRLAELKLSATCPPAGASSWRTAWSSQLWRLGAVEVVILADNDRAGGKQAQRMATALFGYSEVPMLTADAEEPWRSWTMAESGDPELASLNVKLVMLPGLPPGGDVVDWLDAGHTRDELLSIAAATPFWTRDFRARQREARRRAQTRDRVRRLRERRADGARRVQVCAVTL